MITKTIDWFRSFWFWITASLFLLLFFGLQSNSAIQTFYFLSSLLPIVIGTSIIVNEKLIPNYLITRRFGLFALYSCYTLIISLYLQYIAIFIAIYVFNFYVEGSNFLSNLSISTLNLSLYILIIISAFIHLFGIFTTQNIQPVKGTTFSESEQKQQITVRYNRTNYPIYLADILYIESLSDYIKIVLDSEEIITKERISKIQERLTSCFIRIHRSFIVNKGKISSYNKEYVSIGDTNLPISRTYKKETMDLLS